MKEKLISIDPEVMSCTPVFNGTRVPIYILFDYIEGGEPLIEFLENYPSVSREQAVNVLELAEKFVTIADWIPDKTIRE